MFSTSEESMKILEKTIDQNPLLRMEVLENSCITIHPMTMASKRAVYNLKLIKNRIINGEFKGLVLKDGFQRYNLNSLTVCMDTDRNHNCYNELIDEI